MMEHPCRILGQWLNRAAPLVRTACLCLVVSVCVVGQAQIEREADAVEEKPVVIHAEYAKDHIGETVAVCGRVAGTLYLERSEGRPTFLNLERPYPNQALAILIPGVVRDRFPSPPEVLYGGREVCVTGEIQWRRASPQVVVSDPEAIRPAGPGDPKSPLTGDRLTP